MTNKTIVALVIFLLVFSIASHAQSKSPTKLGEGVESSESKVNELTEESRLFLALESVFAYSLPISKEELSINIGVVDLQRVVDESQKGIEARRYFEGFISLISEEDLRMMKQQVISEIVKEIEVVIKEYAKREGFTDIMEKLEGGVISNNKGFDITNEIIELYDGN